MIQYRPFRDPDSPKIVEVWNDSFDGRSAVTLPYCTELEEHVLCKMTFDPSGLILAEDGGRPVGFAHAAFGPKTDESAVSTQDGVVAMVAVRPSHRRRRIGSVLLRLCLDHLREAGSQQITAGSVQGNPFYLGLYGGSSCTGFLASDAAAQPFLLSQGFTLAATSEVLHRRLAGNLGIADGRFAEHRKRYDFRAAPRHGIRSWWHEVFLGPVELYDFFLDEKATGATVARVTMWEMTGFSQRWSESAAGLVEIEVRDDRRRRGLARFLLAQTFRYLQDQYFTVVETQVPRDDAVILGLCRGLGFHAVDASHVYRLP